MIRFNPLTRRDKRVVPVARVFPFTYAKLQVIGYLMFGINSDALEITGDGAACEVFFVLVYIAEEKRC